MSHFRVIEVGAMFLVHADDSGYNVLGYTKKKRARRRAFLLNVEDKLSRDCGWDSADVKMVMNIITECLEEQ